MQDEWVALTLTPDPLHINLLGGPNDCLQVMEKEFPEEIKLFYKRHCLSNIGEAAGGKFNGPSIKKILKNLDDLEKSLPDIAGPLVNFLRISSKLHTMCIEDTLRENYQETLDEFEDVFETVYELFEMNMTLKIHVIIHHYADFFKLTGKNMKTINGEHHEALHHTLKDFERKKGYYMRKNLGSLIHMQKSLKSISQFNSLRAGFLNKQQLRLRKSSTSCSSSPGSSPFKMNGKGYNFDHAFVLSTISE